MILILNALKKWAAEKKNVLAITWRSQITENNDFSIAIEDHVQFEHYVTYLKNIIKICRIVENGESSLLFFHFYFSANPNG